MLIPTEKKVKQDRLFNAPKFGRLKFFLVITCKRTNIFFNFYCKASKFPSKVFVIFKDSLGIKERDNIRKKLSPKVLLRGRKKQQFLHIKTKFNMVKSYIYEFSRVHAQMKLSPVFNIVWKIHKYNINVQNLLRHPFEFFYEKNSSVVAPRIMYHICFKFPHNGCRPKKVRRVRH